MENSLWYNQFSYNEEPGPSWNTPATAAPPCNSTSATPPSSMPWPLPETVSSSQTGSTSGSGTGTGSGNNLAHDNEQDSYAEHHRDSSLIMGLSDNSLEKSPMSKANKGKPMKSSYLLGRPLWDFKFCSFFSLLNISDRQYDVGKLRFVKVTRWKKCFCMCSHHTAYFNFLFLSPCQGMR